jgi:hypothetical protein
MAKGKADIARARAGLNVERLRLKEDRLALEREWARLQRTQEAAFRERDQAVAFLRRLCERYGDNDWADDTPLAEILAQHLADPLADGMRTIRRQMDQLQRALHAAETLPAAAPVLVPPPTAPPPRGSAICTVEVVRGERAVASYRAVCSCSWQAPIRSAQHAAEADRGAHARTHTLRREAAR